MRREADRRGEPWLAQLQEVVKAAGPMGDPAEGEGGAKTLGIAPSEAPR
jgi:hypothetical protein